MVFQVVGASNKEIHHESSISNKDDQVITVYDIEFGQIRIKTTGEKLHLTIKNIIGEELTETNFDHESFNNFLNGKSDRFEDKQRKLIVTSKTVSTQKVISSEMKDNQIILQKNDNSNHEMSEKALKKVDGENFLNGNDHGQLNENCEMLKIKSITDESIVMKGKKMSNGQTIDLIINDLDKIQLVNGYGSDPLINDLDKSKLVNGHDSDSLTNGYGSSESMNDHDHNELVNGSDHSYDNISNEKVSLKKKFAELGWISDSDRDSSLSDSDELKVSEGSVDNQSTKSYQNSECDGSEKYTLVLSPSGIHAKDDNKLIIGQDKDMINEDNPVDISQNGVHEKSADTQLVHGDDNKTLLNGSLQDLALTEEKSPSVDQPGFKFKKRREQPKISSIFAKKHAQFKPTRSSAVKSEVFKLDNKNREFLTPQDDYQIFKNQECGPSGGSDKKQMPKAIYKNDLMNINRFEDSYHYPQDVNQSRLVNEGKVICPQQNTGLEILGCEIDGRTNSEDKASMKISTGSQVASSRDDVKNEISKKDTASVVHIKNERGIEIWTKAGTFSKKNDIPSHLKETETIDTSDDELRNSCLKSLHKHLLGLLNGGGQKVKVNLEPATNFNSSTYSFELEEIDEMLDQLEEMTEEKVPTNSILSNRRNVVPDYHLIQKIRNAQLNQRKLDEVDLSDTFLPRQYADENDEDSESSSSSLASSEDIELTNKSSNMSKSEEDVQALGADVGKMHITVDTTSSEEKKDDLDGYDLFGPSKNEFNIEEAFALNAYTATNNSSQPPENSGPRFIEFLEKVVINSWNNAKNEIRPLPGPNELYEEDIEVIKDVIKMNSNEEESNQDASNDQEKKPSKISVHDKCECSKCARSFINNQTLKMHQDLVHKSDNVSEKFIRIMHSADH